MGTLKVVIALALIQAFQETPPLERILPEVHSAVMWAVAAQTGETPNGPIYLDLRAIRTVAESGGVSLDSSAVERAWGGPTATKMEVIRGDYPDLVEYGELRGEPRGMWVKDDGVYVAIDDLSETPDGYYVVVSYLYTSDYQPRGLRQLGCATHRFELRYGETGTLKVTDTRVLGVC